MFQDKLKIGARRKGVLLALASVILLGSVVCSAQTVAPKAVQSKSANECREELGGKFKIAPAEVASTMVARCLLGDVAIQLPQVVNSKSANECRAELAEKLERASAEAAQAMVVRCLLEGEPKETGQKQETATPTPKQHPSALLKKAKAGDADAQFRLGTSLPNSFDFDGDGNIIDNERVKWLKRAAQQGHSGAKLRLAEMAAKGGVPTSGGAQTEARQKAMTWDELSATPPGNGRPKTEDKKPTPNIFDQFDKPSNARTPIGLFDDILKPEPSEAGTGSAKSLSQTDNSHTIAWGFGAAVFIAVALLTWLRFKKKEAATGVGVAAQLPIYERDENSYAEGNMHNLHLSVTKGNAMSQNQKHILMAVLAIVAAMLVYPPFQIIANNGTVFNMGYGWIFDAPKRGSIIANVNVPMLLIQWVGALIVGGITFFLAKSSPQESRVSGFNAESKNSSHLKPDPMLGTKLEKLQSARNLFFIALAIDIAVTVIVISSVIWAIGAMKDIESGVRTGDPSLASGIDFWGSFSKIMILTTIGVGLGLVKWLNSCYQFSKESLHATGFKQEGWLGAGWIIPFFNLFKPYQVINEIYRAGSPTYSSGDDWKKESGSGLILTWWIFWAVTHLLMITIGKEIVRKTFLPDIAIQQIIGIYEVQAWLCAISIIIAGLWFVVANHLTQRLVDRSSRYAPLPQPSFPDSTKVAPISSGQHSVQNAASVVQNALVATPIPSSSPRNSYSGAGEPAQTDTGPTQQATPTGWKAVDESDENRIYAAIAKELEDGVQDKGLWTRLFAETDGDEKQTKVLYIKQRAERLMVAERMRREQVASREQVEREQEARLLQERIKTQATDKLIQDTIIRFQNGYALANDDVKLLARAATKDAKVAQVTDRMRGNNLLHWCALLDLDHEAATLLRYGADAAAPNGNGLKPFQLAHNLALAAVLKAAATTSRGTCPNSRCKAVIPLTSQVCPKCGAFFEDGSTWSVHPLEP